MDNPRNIRPQNSLRVVPGTTNRTIGMRSDLVQNFMECGTANSGRMNPGSPGLN